VQAIELLLIASGILLGVALVAVRFRHVTLTDHTLPRILLGVVPGVIGALLILVSRMDIVPDDAESDLWGVALVAISAIAIVGTTYRVARR
jgi:hypothetical protein